MAVAAAPVRIRPMRAIPRDVATGRRMKTIEVGGTKRAAEK